MDLMPAVCDRLDVRPNAPPDPTTFYHSFDRYAMNVRGRCFASQRRVNTSLLRLQAMEPNWDEFPDESEQKIKSLTEDMSLQEIFSNLVEALINEALEAPGESYREPYVSGSMAVWDITSQIGIDTDIVRWWLVTLAYKQDGSPIFLVTTDGDVMKRAKIERSELSKLADGFEAADEHSMRERMQNETNSDKNESLSSEVSPKKITEAEWDYIVDEEAAKRDEQTLVIRRSPALDNESLGAYVLERRNVSGSNNSLVSIGAFLGHHGLRFANTMREAVSRYD